MKSKLFDVYSKYKINITSAKDVHLFDDKGIKYLDLYGGHGVISIGHTHPEYIQNLQEQLGKIMFYSNSIEIPQQEELAEKLTQISGYIDYQLFLCNSGAEANENALKMASFHTGKKKFIAFNGSFHGRTAAALNVTANVKLSAPMNFGNYPVEFVPLNDENMFSEAISSNDVAGVIIEGIQGVGGLDMPTNEFLQFLENSCKKNGIVLILDEIQSGYGRTGKFFAHQYAGIKADIISMAKGMGNGFPIGGILIPPEMKAKKGMLGTTFGGNHLACVAANSVLDVIQKENLIQNASELGSWFKDKFSNQEGVKKVKGNGLMLGVEYDFPISKLREELVFEHKIFTGNSDNPNLLRILPPLTITKDALHSFEKALEKYNSNEAITDRN